MLPFLRVDTITTKAINRLIITNVEHKLVLHELELKLELELHILRELELGAYASELEPELELNPYELELELRAYKKQMFRFEIHAYTFNRTFEKSGILILN